MKRHGFTLVELVVIIIVVGILAVTAIPRMLGRNDVNQRGFVDKALTTLQYARSVAVASRHYVCVTINTASAPNASPPSPNLTLTIDPGPYPDPVTIFPACPATALLLPAPDGNCGGVGNASCAPANVTMAATVAAIVFDAAGRPSANGTITITGGGSTNTITVHNETGYVSSP